MNRLRSLRFERGVTIETVSSSTGLSRHTVMRLESGASPQAPTAKAMADFYGCKVTELWPVEPPEPDEVAA